MTIEEATQFLTSMHFVTVQGEMTMIFGEHEVKESILGVRVSRYHHCFDSTCNTIHLVATKTALSLMSELKMVAEELADNR